MAELLFYKIKRLAIMGFVASFLFMFIDDIIPSIATIPLVNITAGSIISMGIVIFVAEKVAGTLDLYI